MPRVISWGRARNIAGIDKIVVINSGRIRIVFGDKSYVEIYAYDKEDLELQDFDKDGNYTGSEPIALGWGGHA